MSVFSQIFPPAPSFTEKDVGDLSGKIFLITGAASGVGLELAKILFSKNGTVYIAARSLERANSGIRVIQAAHPAAKGRLVPLAIDISNLTTIKPAVERFCQQESRLDVLVHNAGIMVPPAGSKSKQGYDLEMATNCLGPFLLSRLLRDIMTRTVTMEQGRSYCVRTVWVSSMIAVGTPQGGVVFNECGEPKQLKATDNYMQTKAGIVFLAAENAKRLAGRSGVHVSLHPGLMRTELQRNMPAVVGKAMGALLKPAKFGAYSELFVALSPEVRSKDNGTFFIPWGRKGVIPKHIAQGIEETGEGGQGTAKRFSDWCERETAKYL